MNRSTALLASIAVTSIGFAAVPLFAEDPAPKIATNMTFVEMAKKSPDGMIEKKRVMASLDRTFDMADTEKQGKLNERQAKQFQEFLKQFTRGDGA